MFKVAAVDTSESLKEAKEILKAIFEESPKNWPYGLNTEHFDGGLYLIREKRSSQAVGFCGWQIRREFEEPNDKQAAQMQCVKVGYYSIGILPKWRNNGFAKSALQKLISFKSASVDRVKALIVAGNTPSIALASSLGVPALIKMSAARRLSKSAHSRTERTLDGAGAVAGGTAGAGILATGLGKAAPSFIDMGHAAFTGPSGHDLFQALAEQDPHASQQLQHLAEHRPLVFKAMLAGIKVPGINPEMQAKARTYAFNLRPSESQLGDVLVHGNVPEMKGGIGRTIHALTGSGMHHTALGMPKHMNQFLFSAGRGQGLQSYKGDLSDMPGPAAVLRAKNPLDPGKVAEGVETAFAKPYSYGLRNRIAAHEVLSTPWSDRSGPTILEKLTGKIMNRPTLRGNISRIPGMRDYFTRSRLGSRCMEGGTCSTTVAEALRHADPGLLGKVHTNGVAPASFLRGIGKDFDVVSLNLPSAMQGKGELALNHLMKAGPMLSRAAIATPFLAGAAYLGNRALRPNDSSSSSRFQFPSLWGRQS